MDVTMRTSFNLPYTHYAMIYLDNLGRLKVQESSSIRETNGTVFTLDVQDKFLEILGAKIGYRRPTIRSTYNAYFLSLMDILTNHFE